MQRAVVYMPQRFDDAFVIGFLPVFDAILHEPAVALDFTPVEFAAWCFTRRVPMSKFQ